MNGDKRDEAGSKWPIWKKVLAYAALAAISLAAIWLVDVKVHRSAVMPLSGTK